VLDHFNLVTGVLLNDSLSWSEMDRRPNRHTGKLTYMDRGKIIFICPWTILQITIKRVNIVIALGCFCYVWKKVIIPSF